MNRNIKNKGLSRFLSVFTLISRIPVKAEFTIDFSRADFWIPAISIFVSMAAAAGFYLGMFFTGSAFVAAGCAILSQYWFFNLFHLDGLLDSADALLPAASKERRLEILKDPRVGTYGFFAGFMALGLRFALLASGMSEGRSYFHFVFPALLTAPIAGRLSAALLARFFKPASDRGLGALMRDFSLPRIAAGTAAALVPLAIFSLGSGAGADSGSGGWLLFVTASVILILSALAVALLVGKKYTKEIGGFTGDSLGCAIELGELLFLFLFCAARTWS